MSVPRGRSRRAAPCLAAALLLGVGTQPATPQEAVWTRPTLNFMGVPGLLDIPTAHQMRDADLSLTLGGFQNTRRGTLHFQITPRLSGVFRYVELRDFSVQDPYYDRSFDLRYQIFTETDIRPAIAVGLQDCEARLQANGEGGKPLRIAPSRPDDEEQLEQEPYRPRTVANDAGEPERRKQSAPFIRHLRPDE